MYAKNDFLMDVSCKGVVIGKPDTCMQLKVDHLSSRYILVVGILFFDATTLNIWYSTPYFKL